MIVLHLWQHPYVIATNLLHGTLKIFHRGELIKPVLASAAVPGLFASLPFKNGYYVNGGMLNNFPINLNQDVLRPNCGRLRKSV
jgi:NTE family protein